MSGAKEIFFDSTCHPTDIEISDLVDSIMNPDPVSLNFYARDNIENYQQVTEIPKENLDYLTSGLVASGMRSTFSLCRKLLEIPNLDIDTSQCSDFDDVFSYLRSITDDKFDYTWLELSSKDLNLDRAFISNALLKHIDFNKCKSSNGTIRYMHSAFQDCSSLEDVKFGNLDFSGVSLLNNLFRNCKALKSTDLFDNRCFDNLSNTIQMFSGCTSLEEVNWVIKVNGSFIGVEVLKQFQSSANMFNGCTNLKNVSIKFKWDSGSIPVAGNIGKYALSFSSTFKDCTSLQEVNWGLNYAYDKDEIYYLSGLNDIGSMFENCSSLTTVILGTGFLKMHGKQNKILSNVFAGCTKLGIIISAQIEASNVLTTASMFDGCESLYSKMNTIYIENYVDDENTSTSCMFRNCTHLSVIDLSEIMGPDTTKYVRDMGAMFKNCQELTTLGGVIDMSNCKVWQEMFYNCPKLTGVQIKNPPAGFDGAGLSSNQYTIVS